MRERLCAQRRGIPPISDVVVAQQVNLIFVHNTCTQRPGHGLKAITCDERIIAVPRHATVQDVGGS